ncbi:hypothetical protein J2X20_001227 [Pelomonas saccharophila]|uniref:HEAT repeat domain-containing protein n=1 Tax=Roseateles saccharophilus TaxID=304 RepID=A0ABU1YIF2_ROSSA|nr:DUF5691 domain-containing protein [Roseateles saccharophilus]MDR7268598.1 hypothetical protein [Roseateles saccharophilus]
MSSAWTALLPAATVGTDRHAAALPSWPGDIGDAIRQAADAAPDPATALLRTVAVLAACSMAGTQGAAVPAGLPAPAAAETLPAPGPGLVFDALRLALFDGPPRLPHEACLILAQAGLRLPELLLPQALELGRRSIALRAALLPALGQRGLWLAAQREDWAYAAGVTEDEGGDTPWLEGTLEQRRAWLARLRAADPGAGRDRLQAALAELPARERADLAGALATELSLADEALLETLRSDRSKEVRQAALQLLLRLPDASHPRRAMDRLAPLLTQERDLLLRKRWQIDAPAAAASDWKADQIDAVRPTHESLGERAWWLYQLVRQTPLGWWSRHTGMTVPELLAWAAGTDWSEALVRGWADVLFAAPDDAWCDALLDRWPPALREDPARVLGLLPPAARDRHLTASARNGSQQLALVLMHALNACPPGQSLSAELSGVLVRALHNKARDGALNTDYGLRGQLADFACVAHPGSFGALADLPRRADETPGCTEVLALVDRTIAARRALHTLIPTRTP